MRFVDGSYISVRLVNIFAFIVNVKKLQYLILSLYILFNQERFRSVDRFVLKCYVNFEKVQISENIVCSSLEEVSRKKVSFTTHIYANASKCRHQKSELSLD